MIVGSIQDKERWRETAFNHFEEGKTREAGKLDNIIFVVATGTFIVSINYIIGLKDQYLYFGGALMLSWVSLLLAISMHAWAYRTSISYHQDMINQLVEWPEKGYKDPPPYPRKDLRDRVSFLDNATLFFLIIGLITMTVFAVANFRIKNIQNGLDQRVLERI